MKKLLVLALIVAIVGLSGCITPNAAFVGAVENAWDVIGPEYVELVEASTHLDEDAKRIRRENAESLTDLIKAARGGE